MTEARSELPGASNIESARVKERPILAPVEQPSVIKLPETFNQTLRRIITEKKISQRKLAKVSGVNHSTISRLIRGERSPRISTIAQIDKGLAELDNGTRFSPTEIFGWLLNEASGKENNFYVARFISSIDSLGQNWEPDPAIYTSPAKTPQEKFQDYRGYKTISETKLREVAAKSGGIVDHSTISRFESGDRDIYLRFLLGVSIGANLKPEQVLDLYRSLGMEKSDQVTSAYNDESTREDSSQIRPAYVTWGGLSKKIRVSKDISTDTLGQLIGRESPTISALEKSGKLPSIAFAADLAVLGELEPHEILGAFRHYLPSANLHPVAIYFEQIRNSSTHTFDPLIRLEGETPEDKVRIYMEKKNLSCWKVARNSGFFIDEFSLHRFVAKRGTITTRAYLGISAGLELKPEEALDLFYSFSSIDTSKILLESNSQ